jgi:hypothetical protein
VDFLAGVELLDGALWRRGAAVAGLVLELVSCSFERSV